MKNLVKLYKQTEETRDGLLWYYRAHDFCKALAEKYSLSLSVVCGVVSALSPATSWERNKLEAEAMMSGRKTSFTTYRPNVVKARKILRGKLDPMKAFSLSTGPKTYNFFHNLLCPSCDHHVTIDRHAFRIATGEDYRVVRPAHYKRIADHYRRAAKRLGIRPSELQAVLWVAHREENDISKRYDKIPF